MRYEVQSELTYDIITDTTMILNIEAQNGGRQRVLNENLYLNPYQDIETYTMPETGNRYRRLRLRPGRITISYRAEVETTPIARPGGEVRETPIASLPFEALPHLSGSRYCEVETLSRFAWREFGNGPNGYARVDAICSWIHTHVDYLAGSSDGNTTAADTFAMRAGVCRDFAHLGITLTRALGIPARFVSAYAKDLEPQDFHAVFEAFLDGDWYLFDPTRLAKPDEIVRIAAGRDAADSAFATFYGQLDSQPKIVNVRRLDNDLSHATDAVSLAGA